jgi:hypothetical protein
MMPRKKTSDVPDMEATRYEYGNGRFDLMTDEEVRTISASDFEMFFARLTDAMRQGESGPMQELYHRLYELRLRYPDRDFRLEVLPEQYA